MQDFRKLIVWQEAQTFMEAVHGATAVLRGNEGSVLRGQIRRAAMSIGANIAEGTASGSPKRFAAFLQNAIASASEVESHLDACRRLRILPTSTLDILSADVVRIRRRTIALRKRVLDAGNPEPTTKNPKPSTDQ